MTGSIERILQPIACDAMHCAFPRLRRFFPRRQVLMAIVPLVLSSLTACPMNNLPRNMDLKAFNPHRPDFVCKHEVDANPVPTQEAEILFMQGMAATTYELLPDQRDYKKAAEVWKQAAALGHWKAALNLAGLYEQGLGVPPDSEQAVLIAEGLMRQGVPAAFDKMGTYHQQGIGVNQDTSRAYAFWQLAAEMGSAAAQAYIGIKIDGTYDNPGQGFWGNHEVGLKMLECGFAQGNGDAAEELGMALRNAPGNSVAQYARALRIYHEGVKFGSDKCASALSVLFARIESITGNKIDRVRAERYTVLADALEWNPDLRFPNLDKVLPLPPADLPSWNGKRDTLVDAAKGVIQLSAIPPSAESSLAGRAHIPDGYRLVAQTHGMQPVDRDARVPYTGYWYPALSAVRRDHEREWQDRQLAQRYFARTTTLPAKSLRCKGMLPCPRTGIWYASVDPEHSHARLYNEWTRTAYLHKGEPFPDPRESFIDIAPHEVIWRWLDNANQKGPSGTIEVTLTDLHPSNDRRDV